jgi:hypothetical protein
MSGAAAWLRTLSETARRLGARAVLAQAFTKAEILAAVRDILGPGRANNRQGRSRNHAVGIRASRPGFREAVHGRGKRTACATKGPRREEDPAHPCSGLAQAQEVQAKMASCCCWRPHGSHAGVPGRGAAGIALGWPMRCPALDRMAKGRRATAPPGAASGADGPRPWPAHLCPGRGGGARKQGRSSTCAPSADNIQGGRAWPLPRVPGPAGKVRRRAGVAGKARAMLAEALLYARGALAGQHERHGHLTELVGIWARYRRQRNAWAEPSHQCADAVPARAEACPGLRTAWSWGPGCCTMCPWRPWTGCSAAWSWRTWPSCLPPSPWRAAWAMWSLCCRTFRVPWTTCPARRAGRPQPPRPFPICPGLP